jgi:hypothetical protein
MINFSGPAKKLGDKIITGLGIGASGAAIYGGVKEISRDIRKAFGDSDSNTQNPSGSNNGSGNDSGSNKGTNNDNGTNTNKGSK